MFYVRQRTRMSNFLEVKVRGRVGGENKYLNYLSNFIVNKEIEQIFRCKEGMRNERRREVNNIRRHESRETQRKMKLGMSLVMGILLSFYRKGGKENY